jgi:hypothetical protein
MRLAFSGQETALVCFVHGWTNKGDTVSSRTTKSFRFLLSSNSGQYDEHKH